MRKVLNLVHVAHSVGAYPSFCRIKCVGVLLLLLDGLPCTLGSALYPDVSLLKKQWARVVPRALHSSRKTLEEEAALGSCQVSLTVCLYPFMLLGEE